MVELQPRPQNPVGNHAGVPGYRRSRRFAHRDFKRYGVDLSPATVRNVMSDLKISGSASRTASVGRVPTDPRLRFFVDSPTVRQSAQRARGSWRRTTISPFHEIDAAPERGVGKVLSDSSSHTVVLMTLRVDADVLRHIEFVSVKERAPACGVGQCQRPRSNKLVTHEEPLSSEDPERITNYLNNKPDGEPLRCAQAHRHRAGQRAHPLRRPGPAGPCRRGPCPVRSPTSTSPGRAKPPGATCAERYCRGRVGSVAPFQALEDQRILLRRLLEQN